MNEVSGQTQAHQFPSLEFSAVLMASFRHLYERHLLDLRVNSVMRRFGSFRPLANGTF